MKKIAILMMSMTGILFLGTLLGIQYMSEERGLSEPKPLLFKAENSDSLPARESNDKVELLQKQEQSDEVGKGNFFFRAWSEPVSRAKSADPNNS